MQGASRALIVVLPCNLINKIIQWEIPPWCALEATGSNASAQLCTLEKVEKSARGLENVVCETEQEGICLFTELCFLCGSVYQRDIRPPVCDNASVCLLKHLWT